jgi:hypothetical protein
LAQVPSLLRALHSSAAMSISVSSPGAAEKPDLSEKNLKSEGTIVALSNDDDQPSVLEGPDPNDSLNPQNWSPWKKRLLFLALMSSSILADG